MAGDSDDEATRGHGPHMSKHLRNWTKSARKIGGAKLKQAKERAQRAKQKAKDTTNATTETVNSVRKWLMGPLADAAEQAEHLKDQAHKREIRKGKYGFCFVLDIKTVRYAVNAVHFIRRLHAAGLSLLVLEDSVSTRGKMVVMIKNLMLDSGTKHMIMKAYTYEIQELWLRGVLEPTDQILYHLHEGLMERDNNHELNQEQLASGELVQTKDGYQKPMLLRQATHKTRIDIELQRSVKLQQRVQRLNKGARSHRDPRAISSMYAHFEKAVEEVQTGHTDNQLVSCVHNLIRKAKQEGKKGQAHVSQVNYF